MNVNENETYKFERKVSHKEVYSVRVSKEFFEDLENFQNLNDVILDVNDKIGTFTIQTIKSSKVFNLNIEPIARGEKECLELNSFRSNRTIETVAPLTVRLNVQATSRVFEKAKNVQENTKELAKQIKLSVHPNKNNVSSTLFQNKDNAKVENSFNNRISIKPSVNPLVRSGLHDPKKLSQFTIREKVLNLLALKPISKDMLLINLHRLSVTSVERSEVDKCLHQLTTVSKDNLLQLSSQYVFEIQEDWPLFNEENRKFISKLKADAKSKLSNRINSENKKTFTISPKSHRSDRHETISPAESNTSSKTITSTDEGFVSGDKRSPFKLSNSSQSKKRTSQYLTNNNPSENVAPKKMCLSDKKQCYSHNDFNSSSSSNATPISDVSPSTNTLKSKQCGLDYKISINGASKINKVETQALFNTAYEEYSQLCLKLKDREDEIEKLRYQSKNAKVSDYGRMYKLAKSLLDQLETPGFQKIIARVKKLESEMCAHVRILNGKLLN